MKPTTPKKMSDARKNASIAYWAMVDAFQTDVEDEREFFANLKIDYAHESAQPGPGMPPPVLDMDETSCQLSARVETLSKELERVEALSQAFDNWRIAMEEMRALEQGEDREQATGAEGRPILRLVKDHST